MDPDFEAIDASHVFVDSTVEELLPEDVVISVTKDGTPSYSIAVWARCIGYIGFGTSLLSLGLLLLVPHFLTAANQPVPAEPGQPRPRRQRRSTITGIELHGHSSSLLVGHPRRAITLPQYHTTKSCLEKRPTMPGRRVTFVDLELPRSIATSVEPPAALVDEIQVYTLCDDDSSTTSSVTSSSMSSPSMAIFGASSLPSTPSPTATEHLLLTIPETEYVLEDVSPKRRRTLVDKIPRVTKLFSGWRKHGVSSPPVSPTGSDETTWSPKQPKPFIFLSHRRKAVSPSVSGGSSPAASPVEYFSPLPSPSVPLESQQSYFRRRSSDRRRNPVARTEPYGAPYFAAPPTSPLPRAPTRRRSRSLTRRSEDIRLSSEREQQVGRPPIARMITKRRSASADCILRKSLRV